MSKQRMINTKFWDDAYSSNLDPIEKLLFLYFLTNTSTNICGIYEIPLKKIAMETGIEKEMVEKIVSRFEKDHKVFYRNGWIGLVNFIKNQNQKSPMVQKGIERELEEAPKDLKTLILEGIDTLSHLTKPNLTKPNLTKVVVSQENVFERFWIQYPKKELKKKSKEIWERKNLDDKIESILTFIEKAKQTDRWKKGFVKQPTTFLNGECWNDDLASYGNAGTSNTNVYKNTNSSDMVEKLKAKQLN